MVGGIGFRLLANFFVSYKNTYMMSKLHDYSQLSKVTSNLDIEYLS